MIDVRAQFPLEPGYPRWAMDWDRADAIVIHHTAVDPRSPEDVALLLPAADMTPADELNHIKIIHLYHKSIGFGGFAYHLIVFPSGRCYYVTSLYVWGAHIGGMNDGKFGICAAGDFRSISPGTAQFQGLWEAINFIRDSLTFALRVGPHSQWTSTSCPGMAWPLPEEDDMDTRDLTAVFKGISDDSIRATPEGRGLQAAFFLAFEKAARVSVKEKGKMAAYEGHLEEHPSGGLKRGDTVTLD